MNSWIMPAVAGALASVTTVVLMESLRPAPEPAMAATASPESNLENASLASATAGSGESLNDPALAMAVEDINMRLAALEGRLDFLAEARSEVTPESGDSPVASLASSTSNPELASLILDVVADKEQQERDERAAARLEREQERLLERATTIATELGLSSSDQSELYTVLLNDSSRRTAIFEGLRADGGMQDRGAIRTQMQGLGQQRTDELVEVFGTELAEKIDEADPGNGWRGALGGRGQGGGGGGRGGGGGGGRGGN